MEKLRTASTPVKLNWLVVAKGVQAGDDRERQKPRQVRHQDESVSSEDVRRELRPSGPMFTSTMSSMKPVRPSTAICQRPGTGCLFRAQSHEPEDHETANSIQAALVVKLMS